MATERLRVILSMAASQYRKEARRAAQSTKAVGDEADRVAGRFDGLRSGIRKMGPVASAAGLAATVAMGKFASDSIRDASNLQESINAINVTFGESADGIHALGEESAESFGLSQRAFNEFATRFSAFGKEISEGTGRDVVDIVDEITGRVADFASVHNLSMERAAEVTQSTLAGETEVFRRFGGDVSAATVEMRLLEEGIISQGEAASEQEKILGRYLEFMDQTAVTAGDFANTSDDLANKQRIFTAQLEDTRAEVGEALLPVMTDLLDTGQDLIPVLVTLGEVIGVIARGAALAMAGDDIERIAIASGGAADSAEVLATAIVELDRAGKSGRGPQHMRSQYEDLIDTWGGGSREIETLLDGLDFLTEEMGLTGREAEILEEILRDRLANSLTDAELAARAAFEGTEKYEGGLTDAEQAARDFFNSSEELGGQLDLQGGKWDDVVTSMENYEDMIRRLTDPVFAAIDDQRALEDATQNYIDVMADGDSTVRDQEDAMLDLVQAQIAAEDSASDLPDSLQAAIDHIIILGDRAGITEDDLRKLKDRIMEFDGLTAQSTISINVVGGERVPGDMNRDVVLRHSGGPGRAGQPYKIRPDEEIFVPSGNGEFLLNNEVVDALKGLSSNTNTTTTHNYNIPVQSTGDHNTDAQLVGSISSVLRRMETL